MKNKKGIFALLIAIVLGGGVLMGTVSATSNYDGAVVKFSSPVVYEVSCDDNGDCGIYYYYNEAAFYHDGHSFDEVTQYLDESSLPFEVTTSTAKAIDISVNGVVFKYPDRPEVYITSGGAVEHIANEEAFYSLGLSFDDVLVAFEYSVFGSGNMIFDQLQDYIVPRDLMYTIDMSENLADENSEFGFKSQYGKNVYTYPEYTEGSEFVFDVESQSIWLSNSSVITESSYEGSSDSDYYYIIEGDETESAYDEAVGLMFNGSSLAEDLGIEYEDELRVEFDVMYTGDDAAFIVLGHERSSSGQPVMPFEYYGFEIDNSESFQTYYLQFDYATPEQAAGYGTSMSGWTNGAMLYFGNVDPDEHLLVREVRLYRVQ